MTLRWSFLIVTASANWQISLKMPAIESVRLEVLQSTKNSLNSMRKASKAPADILAMAQVISFEVWLCRSSITAMSPAPGEDWGCDYQHIFK